MGDVFAFHGKAIQQFGGSKPANAIKMKSPRPRGGKYIAKMDGTWELISTNLEKAAKEHRNEVKDSIIEAFGVWWDIDRTSRENIDNAIWSLSWYPEGSVLGWILADNSVRPTTKADLEQVKLAYTQRLDAIYSQYREWRNGTRSQPFQYQP